MIAQRKRTWAEIDLDIIKRNYETIRKSLSAGSKLCCVIKANAYGHGAVELARLYEKLGADWFAVSNIEEALQLRNAMIKLPILILGYTPQECAELLAKNNISQSVYSYEYGKALSENAVSAGVKVKIHIKIDTGMGRIGFRCTGKEQDGEAVSDIIRTCALPSLEAEGVFMHFAVADEGNDGGEYTRKQFENFCSAYEKVEESGIKFAVHHCANSAAIFDYPGFHLDMVRAGIVLYGLKPSDKIVNTPELIPAMQLKSVVSFVKEIDRGDTVSYGRTFTASGKMRIATVAIGYADGFWRSNYKNKLSLAVRGHKCPIVGRVCMDQLMLDVSGVDGVKPGDTVTVFGSDGEATILADDIASANGTINYEVVCAVGERVPRFYISDGKVISVRDDII